MTETERKLIHQRVEANVEAWQAVDELRAEVDRLTTILRTVRMHCTFGVDDQVVREKIWPLVMDFDAP